MKKLICIILCLSFFIVTGCGNQKTIDGVTYNTYGILHKNLLEYNVFDKNKYANPNIQYEIIDGNMILSIIGMVAMPFTGGVSAVIPACLLGFSIYEPVGKKVEK